jgi:hypothetical protein
MDDRNLAAGSEAVAIQDLLWIGPNMLIAGLSDPIVGRAELRALSVGTREATVIFAEPYSALAWNDTTGQLAIAGSPLALSQSDVGGRKLAPGLFTWSPEAGPPIQIERAPAEALAWAPQGDALAYSVAGEEPGLRLWSIGTEGDIKQLAGAQARELRWSLDGQLLATDIAIYRRDGQPPAAPASQAATLAGWGPQGLFYYTRADGENYDLWLWDGAQPQQIDTGLTRTQGTGVVLTQP